VGGIETMSLLLASQLTRLGHSVIVATAVPAGSEIDRTLPFEVVREATRRDLKTLAQGSDVVHASGFSLTTLAFALGCGRPLIYTHHGYQASCLTGLGWHAGWGHCGYSLCACAARTKKQHGSAYAARQLARHALGRAALRVAARNISVSRFVSDVIRAPSGGVILNCVDPDVMQPGPAATSRTRLLFVGRLVGEKGLPILLRAVAAAGSEVALDVVGGGPLDSEYRGLTRDLAIESRVRFLGPLRGKSLANAYRNAIGVVVPSVWDEAFGIVAAEALSCGRVALVSNRGGLPEVVEGLGTTFPAGDVEALAAVLRRLVMDDEWRVDVERRIPQVAARFTADRMAREYLCVYEAALV
jgi:glycosyltransferase involved in cell wall biosynthesis